MEGWGRGRQDGRVGSWNKEQAGRCGVTPGLGDQGSAVNTVQDSMSALSNQFYVVVVPSYTEITM